MFQATSLCHRLGSMSINHNIYLSWHFLPKKFHSNFQALKVSSSSNQFTKNLTKQLICPLTMGNHCNEHIAGNQNYGINRQVINQGTGIQPSKTLKWRIFASSPEKKKGDAIHLSAAHLYPSPSVLGLWLLPSYTSNLPTSKMAGLFAVRRIQEQQLFWWEKLYSTLCCGTLGDKAGIPTHAGWLQPCSWPSHSITSCTERSAQAQAITRQPKQKLRFLPLGASPEKVLLKS